MKSSLTNSFQMMLKSNNFDKVSILVDLAIFGICPNTDTYATFMSNF